MMISVRKTAMLATLAVTILAAAGCRPSPMVLEAQEQNRRLKHVILKYEEENRLLMRQLEAKDTGDATLQIEIDKQNAQINELKKTIRSLQGKMVLTKKVEHQLEMLAERLGGELVGNRLLLPGDYFFASGQYTLREESLSALRDFAQIMKDENVMLLIVGHTDSDPVVRSKRRGIRSNRHLSMLRSLSVLEALKSSGYNERLMYPTGWGALMPVVSNATSEGKARNRRVEIYIDPAASGLMSVMAITEVGPGEGSAVAPVEADGPVTVTE